MGFPELLILVVLGLGIAIVVNGALGRRPLLPIPRLSGWHVLAMAFVLWLLFASQVGRPEPVWMTGLLLTFLLLALAWAREFVFLMRLADDVFPGRHDKLIWALLLIALPPLGTLAFWSFRRAHWPESKPAAVRSVHDLG